MTWADWAAVAGIGFGFAGIVTAIVSTRIARRSNVIARDAVDRADTANVIARESNTIARESNEIARNSTAHVAESVELQRGAQAAESDRQRAAQAAMLTLEHPRAEWDTALPPQLWHNLGNRGAVPARDVSWQVLESRPDTYGPDRDRPIVISPGESRQYAEWRASQALHRDASIAIVQLRYQYRDGNGDHTLVLRLAIGAPNASRNKGSPTVGVVFATLDGAPYPEIPVDPRLGVYVAI